MASENQWHLNKSVPIALIIAMAGQVVGAAWYMRGLADEVQSSKKDIARIERFVETARDKDGELANRLTAVETVIGAQNKILTRIENHITRSAVRDQIN